MFHTRMAPRAFATLAVALLTLGTLPRAASADSLSYTPVGNLQNLIDDGSNGITVGHTLFYDFAYTGVGSTMNPAPTARQVSVAAIMGGPVGLRFNADWYSAAGFSQVSTISYGVRELDGAIAAANLSFNGAVLLAGQQTSAGVAEILANPAEGSLLGSLSVVNTQVHPPAGALQAALGLSSPASPIRVTESISVHSADSGGGIADISLVDATFRPVPTPLPAACWGGMGLLAWLGIRGAHRRGGLVT